MTALEQLLERFVYRHSFFKEVKKVPPPFPEIFINPARANSKNELAKVSKMNTGMSKIL